MNAKDLAAIVFLIRIQVLPFTIHLNAEQFRSAKIRQFELTLSHVIALAKCIATDVMVRNVL